MKAVVRNRLLIAVVAVLLCTTAAQAWWWDSEEKWDDESTTEISWEQLIPEGFKPVQSPLENMSREQLDKLFDGSQESEKEIAEIEEMMAYAPVVEKLDGQRVKLPGYVVPLDFDGQSKMKEFLLVPYYGACIHTPPPPANQVVHANAQEAIVVEDTYMPVWAIGTLSTETVKSNLAESGYRLKVERIEPYE
jgi:hypothetical protein